MVRDARYGIPAAVLMPAPGNGPRWVKCPHCGRLRVFNFYLQALRHRTNSQARACARIRDAKARLAVEHEGHD